MNFGHFLQSCKMSNFENPNKVSKTPHFSLLDHYANNYYFCIAKFVTLILRFYCALFRRFFCQHILY